MQDNSPVNGLMRITYPMEGFKIPRTKRVNLFDGRPMANHGHQLIGGRHINVKLKRRDQLRFVDEH